MSDQYFEGPVGQVAAGDIINVGQQDLWHFSSEVLRRELDRCQRKLWSMRIALFWSLPFIGMLAITLGGCALVLWVTFYKAPNVPLMMGWAAMVAFFAWRLDLLRKSKGKMIAYYRARIELLDLILQDRT